jgi:hypothetical protein
VVKWRRRICASNWDWLALTAVILARSAAWGIENENLNEHFHFRGFILIVHIYRLALWTPADRLHVTALPPAATVLLVSLAYLVVWSVRKLAALIRLPARLGAMESRAV